MSRRLHIRSARDPEERTKGIGETAMPDDQSMQPMHAMEPMHAMDGDEAVGYLYMQTNELGNAVVHYRRTANGAIEEVHRVATGGAGSGEFKPTSGQESAPNAF